MGKVKQLDCGTCDEIILNCTCEPCSPSYDYEILEDKVHAIIFNELPSEESILEIKPIVKNGKIHTFSTEPEEAPF